MRADRRKRSSRERVALATALIIINIGMFVAMFLTDTWLTGGIALGLFSAIGALSFWRLSQEP